MPEKPSVARVLIISADPANAAEDKESLARMGVKDIEVSAGAADAVRRMLKKRPDMALCDSVVNDGGPDAVFSLLGRNLSLKNIPVVMVTAENREDRVLQAISNGCSGYVLRPYTQEAFRRHMLQGGAFARFKEIEAERLAEGRALLEAANFDDAIEAFEEVVSELEEARRYYDEGCGYLFRKKYGLAIIAFKKAVRINDLYAEAYKGLADAYRGKGDTETSLKYLRKAAEAHALFGRLEETKALFLEILRDDAGYPNPFNTLGVRLRKAGDYEGALRAYAQALELTPEDEHVRYNLAKAHYFRGSLREALAEAEKSVAMAPDFAEGVSLVRELRGQAPAARPARRPPEGEPLLDD